MKQHHLKPRLVTSSNSIFPKENGTVDEAQSRFDFPLTPIVTSFRRDESPSPVGRGQGEGCFAPAKSLRGIVRDSSLRSE